MKAGCSIKGGKLGHFSCDNLSGWDKAWLSAKSLVTDMLGGIADLATLEMKHSDAIHNKMPPFILAGS
jgi:hypothetical protein